MGDLGEGCSGWYPDQLQTIDLHGRAQRKVTRRLLVQLLKEWSVAFPRLLVTVVGGNHGENRQGGRQVTGDGDNSDVGMVEAAADAIRENGEMASRIDWLIPNDELVVAVDVPGLPWTVAATHGHLSPGAKPPGNHWTWWKDQMGGSRPGLAGAQLLLTSHFHHYIVYEPTANRWIIQAPAQDGGSKWFRDKTGHSSTPGTSVWLMDELRPVAHHALLPSRADHRVGTTVEELAA